MTESECRRQYGEAHDAHMEMNGECPWCGAGDEAMFEAATGQMPADAVACTRDRSWFAVSEIVSNDVCKACDRGALDHEACQTFKMAPECGWVCQTCLLPEDEHEAR